MIYNWLSKYIKWVILVIIIGVIEFISIHPIWVERYYTYGVYPYIAVVQRLLLGWISISLGDICYAIIAIIIIINIIKACKAIAKSRVSKLMLWKAIQKVAFIFLWIFVLFYGLWGLNYSRQGIASQLHLNEEKYTIHDLDTLILLLHKKLNHNASLVTPAIRDSFKTKRNLFENGTQLYKLVQAKYPFLSYKYYSVKPSLFSYLGNYLGFQGYYNPFTGEAQVNTTIPLSVEPFVVAHEIAHQLGYAKESEANFVGFLSCKLHPSVHFKYSVYFNMYQYAIGELAYIDSTKAKKYNNALHPQVKKDILEYKNFYNRYRNPIEPYVSQFYGYFLKANNQPRGRESYNDVVTWLIAFYKKYGYSAI